MTAKIELIPLRCIRCETPVPAEGEEIAWVCSQCGQGLLLDERQGLESLDIHYSKAVPAGEKGQPYWVTRGSVNLTREVHQSWQGTRQREADQLWGQKRQFVIPAFTISLDELLHLSTFLFTNPPELIDGPVTPFEAVTLSPRDLSSLIEYIILAVEAGRSDDIKSISVSVEVEAPSLWVLPNFRKFI